jgi:hypothetical protein
MKPLIVVFAIALTAGGTPAFGQTRLCSFVDSHDLSAVKPPLELLGDAGTAKKFLYPGKGGFNKSLEAGGLITSLGLHAWDFTKEWCDGRFSLW